MRKFRNLEFWKFGGIKRRLSQSFACARHHEPSNGFDGVVIQVAERHPHFGFFAYGMRENAQAVTALTDKLDCHGGQSFARLAMTDWRDFACANFITTLNFQASKLPNFYKSLTAFTMAEILISLTIIGVIAAITLPALIGNINERLWDTQRRALHNRISHAIKLMPAINGYGAETYDVTWQTGACSGPHTYCDDIVNIINDNTAMTFVTQGLSKVMQLRNICDKDHLEDCGLVKSVKLQNNKSFPMPKKLSDLTDMFYKRIWVDLNPNSSNASNTQFLPNGTGIDSYAAGIETVNGESLLVLYNNQCLPALDKNSIRFLISEYERDSSWDHSKEFYKWLQLKMGVFSNFYIQSQMCVNFIYDLNGKKGPNKMYKDIGFITVFNPTDSVTVAPVFMARRALNPNNNSMDMSYDLAARACEKLSKNSRVASLNEAMAQTINHNLFGDAGSGIYGVTGWGSADAIINEDYAWAAGEKHGWVRPVLKTKTGTVSCVKK